MALADPKLSNLIENAEGPDGKPWISMEFFPPRTAVGIESLFSALVKLKSFVSIYSI